MKKEKIGTRREKVWGTEKCYFTPGSPTNISKGGNIYRHKGEPDSAGENLQLDVAGSASWGSRSSCLAFSLL